jgi:hypothetical protein
MLEPVWTESIKAKKESEGKSRKANLEVCLLNSHKERKRFSGSDNAHSLIPIALCNIWKTKILLYQKID